MATTKRAKKKSQPEYPKEVFVVRVINDPFGDEYDYLNVVTSDDMLRLGNGTIVAKYELTGHVRVRQETHVESV